MQDHSTIEPASGKRGGRFCSIDGCGMPRYAMGFCTMHYLRDRKGGDMLKPSRNATFLRKCTWGLCSNPHKSKGFCELHYHRMLNGNDMDAPHYRKPLNSRYVNADGYVEIKVCIGKGGWRKEHRYIMEQHIGRALYAKENVHHINGDRADNRLENLELWTTSQPKGQRVTDKIQWAREFLAQYADTQLPLEL